MSRVGMYPIRRERDYVALLHTALLLIKENIKATRKNYLIIQIKQDYVLLRIFEELNKETIYYDGKSLTFEEFINAAAKHTNGRVFSPVKTQTQAKTILIKLMAAIRNVVVRKAVPNKLEEFIEEEHGYNISDKLSINVLNFLMNFKFYHDINTEDFLKTLYPELGEDRKIGWKVVPEPPNLVSETAPPKVRPQPPSNSSRNKPRNAARNAPRNQTRNKPREQSKNKPKNATRKNQNGKKKERENSPKKEKPPAEFPFGAEKTD